MAMQTMTSRWTPLLTLVMILAATGCDDPLEPEEHAEAGGVVLLATGSGTVLSRSIGANAAFDAPLTVPLGGTLEVRVLFLDEAAPADLDRAFPPHEDEGESLRVTVANGAIASFTAHGDHGDFSGLAAGTTTASVDLLHGDHADFESGDLTIVVQ